MICVLPSVKQLWDKLPARDRARTLASERFVDFKDDGNAEKWRRNTSEAIRDGYIMPDAKLPAWRDFIAGLPNAQLLYGALQSRLIVDAAAGVFENGGLCLDRVSGVPFIPGSAVKGCVRRMAIQALADAPQAEKAELLGRIAWVFGWTHEDWKDGRRKKDGKPKDLYSDFEYACGEGHAWITIRKQTASQLAERLKVKIKDDKPIWSQLPSFAGSVVFLPAYPLEKDPGIDLDVITCHHAEYYMGANPEYADAPDTEQPVPVVFACVSAKQNPVFVFAVQETRRSVDGDARVVLQWLSEGLQTFGIGGKTNSGYGWFDCSSSVQEKGSKVLNAQAEEVAKRKAEALQKEQEQAKLNSLSGPDRCCAEIHRLDSERFSHFAKALDDKTDDEKMGFFMTLKTPEKKEWWKTKKKKDEALTNRIRAIAQTMGVALS